MREYERFCGVKVVTYCVMSNHFHILLPRSGNGLGANARTGHGACAMWIRRRGCIVCGTCRCGSLVCEGSWEWGKRGAQAVGWHPICRRDARKRRVDSPPNEKPEDPPCPRPLLLTFKMKPLIFATRRLTCLPAVIRWQRFIGAPCPLPSTGVTCFCRVGSGDRYEWVYTAISRNHRERCPSSQMNRNIP